MITVLIADDEKLVRSTMRKTIPWLDLGVNAVFEAEDGAKGLDIARQEHPAIVISDIKMPHMNGIDFGKALRSELPKAKLVFFTAYTDKEYLKDAIHLKVDGYIEKPLVPSEIKQLIQDLVSQCLEEQAALEPDRVFFHDSPDTALSNTSNFTLSKTALAEFTRLLRNRSWPEALRFLADLYSQMEHSDGSSPDFIRSVFSRLTTQVESVAELHGARRTQNLAGQFVCDALNATRLSQLEQTLDGIIRNMEQELIEATSDPVASTQEYLMARYMDPDLSITEIAGHLNFNAAYLCSLYKNRTRKTINGALTEIRMNAAKELLSRTTLKLYEVAERVGYRDAKYFTRLFSKEVGVSPRQYRERYHV